MSINSTTIKQRRRHLVSISMCQFLICACATKTVQTDFQIVENFCSRHPSGNGEAQIVFVDKYGKQGTEFFCVFKKTDPVQESLPELTILLRQKKSSNKKKKIVQNYLKNRCPIDWTATIDLNPLGWSCHSNNYPLSQLCPKGEPMAEQISSSPHPVVCISQNLLDSLNPAKMTRDRNLPVSEYEPFF